MTHLCPLQVSGVVWPPHAPPMDSSLTIRLHKCNLAIPAARELLFSQRHVRFRVCSVHHGSQLDSAPSARWVKRQHTQLGRQADMYPTGKEQFSCVLHASFYHCFLLSASLQTHGTIGIPGKTTPTHLKKNPTQNSRSCRWRTRGH